MQEDEVLFERTDEDPIMVATTSVDLTQATSHNISVLNEKVNGSYVRESKVAG